MPAIAVVVPRLRIAEVYLKDSAIRYYKPRLGRTDECNREVLSRPWSAQSWLLPTFIRFDWLDPISKNSALSDGLV